MFLDVCYKSQDATAESQLQAVHLMSACALADPDVYTMLLLPLEQEMWHGRSCLTQQTAAAGTRTLLRLLVSIISRSCFLDGVCLDSLCGDCYHHLQDAA